MGGCSSVPNIRSLLISLLLDGPVLMSQEGLSGGGVGREEGICFSKCLFMTLSERQAVRALGFCNWKLLS